MKIFRKKQVSLADLEEEKRAAEKATETPIYNSGKAEYEEKSHINDEKKPQTQRGFEQSEDWEEITEEPEESPWDPKLDESVSPDPLAAASGSIYVPEEKKQIVTASGKVIEAETDLLKKKLESTRAAEAAASVPKADPFMAPRSSNEKVRITSPSEEESSEAVAKEIAKQEVEKEYIFPPTDLLKKPVRNNNAFSENEYKATAIKLQQTLHNFGVGVTVTNISCGPSVTRYELLPEQGVKVSKYREALQMISS